MPDTPNETDRELPALGALLELLHRADAPSTTAQATYRIWRHDERAAAAGRAEIEEEKRRRRPKAKPIARRADPTQ